MRAAVEHGDLRLRYQPQQELTTGRIVGAEALLRWESPTRGAISPAVFVPVLEESNQIARVGTWVLEEACRQAQRWANEGRYLRVAVNVSARQLTADLPETVERILREYALPAELLELEVTESLAIEPDGRGLDVLRQIEAMGVAIAIDDFGTGHSSLKRLRELPVRTVKVDRMFVEGLTSDAADAAIVAGVITVAHRLGYQVVAEGIETREQLEALRELGCDVAQGFLLGRPVPASDFPPSQVQPVAKAA